jgi:hypothetical protein
MFMEGGDTGQPAQPEPPAPAPASAETSTAPTTRGWTMFMEAQLPAGSAGSDAAIPAPAAKVGSDAKGWTIFVERPAGARAPSEPVPAASAPAPAPAPVVAAPIAAAPVAAAPVGQAPIAGAFEDVRVPAHSVAAEEAPGRAMQGVQTQTVVMREPPVIPQPAHHAPPMETRPLPRPNQVPAVEDAPKSKTPLIIGGVVVLVIIIVIIIAAAT